MLRECQAEFIIQPAGMQLHRPRDPAHRSEQSTEFRVGVRWGGHWERLRQFRLISNDYDLNHSSSNDLNMEEWRAHEWHLRRGEIRWRAGIGRWNRENGRNAGTARPGRVRARVARGNRPLAETACHDRSWCCGGAALHGYRARPHHRHGWRDPEPS